MCPFKTFGGEGNILFTCPICVLFLSRDRILMFGCGLQAELDSTMTSLCEHLENQRNWLSDVETALLRQAPAAEETALQALTVEQQVRAVIFVNY